jgi:hypothetical protein
VGWRGGGGGRVRAVAPCGIYFHFGKYVPGYHVLLELGVRDISII